MQLCRTVPFLQGPSAFFVLDHDVVLPSSETVRNPMRVVANGTVSELLFTVFRRPAMTEDQFATDVDAVRRDLQALKSLLDE